MKWFIVVCAVCMSSVFAETSTKKPTVPPHIREIDSIYMERNCTQQGGLCVIARDCPKEKLHAKKGLCPEQQRIGVECCYGVSVKETRCQKKAGECFPKGVTCRPEYIVTGVTDCGQGETCCILVT